MKKNKRQKQKEMRCPYCGGKVDFRSAEGIYKQDTYKTMLFVCRNYPVLITLCSSLIQSRTAGIGHSQDSAHLVKALAGSVVQGGTQNGHFGIVLHLDDHGVTAGYHKAQERRLQIGVGQIRRRHVAVDMIDRHQRDLVRKRQRFCKVHTHQQGTDQSRM